MLICDCALLLHHQLTMIQSPIFFSVAFEVTMEPMAKSSMPNHNETKQSTNCTQYSLRRCMIHTVATHRALITGHMMTSLIGNTFRATRPLCGELVNSPHKGQWRGALMFSLICAWTNGWVNNHDAGDLRRNRAHNDATVMQEPLLLTWINYTSFHPILCRACDYLYMPRLKLIHVCKRGPWC